VEEHSLYPSLQQAARHVQVTVPRKPCVCAALRTGFHPQHATRATLPAQFSTASLFSGRLGRLAQPLTVCSFVDADNAGWPQVRRQQAQQLAAQEKLAPEQRLSDP
jgi:hypothetical protein